MPDTIAARWALRQTMSSVWFLHKDGRTIFKIRAAGDLRTGEVAEAKALIENAPELFTLLAAALEDHDHLLPAPRGPYHWSGPARTLVDKIKAVSVKQKVAHIRRPEHVHDDT